MDTSVDIPVLQFDTEAKRKPVGSSFKLTNDANPMFDIAHVVVGHFIDEQWS
jgi:hypothetical protein